MKKILIVEDEKQLSDVMCLYLNKEGYSCDTAYDGNSAQELLDKNEYNIIILDVMMPGKDGWSLLRKIKSTSNTPVIMTTARSEEDDRVFGLELGADDYMVKPLSMRELVLRVKLRIASSSPVSNASSSGDVLVFDDLQLNRINHEVRSSGKLLPLTPKEYSLLLHFVENPNIVFSRDSLLNNVWGYDYFGDTRTVDTHVKKLREKIPVCRDNLKTLWKVGYKFLWGDSNE